jgi:hypothetical protein
VVADAALDADPERPDLPWQRALGAGPATGVAFAPAGGHAERRARLGHRRLERPHERPEQEASVGEAEDRVGHELAGTVVGDLAAALDPDDLDPPSGEFPGIGQDVAVIGVPAERQHGRVLEQEQAVTDRTVGAAPGELLLERPRLAVGDPPQPGRADGRRPGGAVLTGRGHRVGLHVPTIAGKRHPAVRGTARTVAVVHGCVSLDNAPCHHHVVAQARSRVFACAKTAETGGARYPICGSV